MAKLCIEIPDALADWLREVSREMATTPEAFIERLLWQYYSTSEATLRTRCRKPRQ